MKLLIFTLIALFFASSPAQANFAGMTMAMAESPAESIENIVDDVIKNSKLEDRMVSQYENVGSLRKALIKGCQKDNEVLRSLVKLRDEILPSVKNLPPEEQEREYIFSQTYLKTVAAEFGYRE